MDLRLLIPMLLAALAAACSTSTPSQRPGTHKKYTIRVGSTERSYLLFLPSDYESDSSPRPLILSYHGGGRDAEQQLELDQFTNPFFNKKALVAYPQGINDTWQGTPNWHVNDIQFTNALLDHLLSYRIDPRRLWASGKSQGGGLVGLLACDGPTSRRIAAFAPVSGAFYTAAPSEGCQPATVAIACSPGRLPVPFAEFHGGQDDTIDYEGGTRRGVCLPAVPHYLAEWAVRNHLSTQPQTSQVGKGVELRSYGGGWVRGYLEGGIGHDWPSTVENADNERRGHGVASYNATSVILDFFYRYGVL